MNNRQDNQRSVPGITNLVAVASNKGGVGKSTISTKINKSLPSPIFYNDGSNPNPLFSPEEFFSENGPLHKSFKIDSYEFIIGSNQINND